MQTKVNNIVFSFLLIFFINFCTYSQEPTPDDFLIPSKNKNITPQNTQDSTIVKSSEKKMSDSKNKLSDIVHRKAKGYEKLNKQQKTVTLYDNAEFKYQDYELTAGIIVYNYDKKEIYAGRIKDSLGNYTQDPVFKQGNQTVKPDSIRFNMDTKKSIVWNARTTYDEFNIRAIKTKKENDSIYYMSSGIFTTAKNINNPEYYFKTNKLKFIPNNKVVTGPTVLVIADVPTPIILPFTFFPLKKEASSGLIFPSYGDAGDRGYYLQNGGYYFAISDYVDLFLSGSYYTNGSYGYEAQSNYALRYKFRGSLRYNFQQNITGELGLPNYSKTRSYNINWSHSQDPKASPNSNFSANVNMGSSNYYQNSINTKDIGANLNNTLSSSISYSTQFSEKPQINMSIGVNHSQIVNTGEINLELPSINANMERIYPFSYNKSVKKGILDNLSINYSVDAKNNISTNDSLFLTKEMFQEMKNGIKHNIPINTNFKIFKYINTNLSANYNEVWYFNTIKKEYDLTENRVVDRKINGFDTYRTYNLSATLGTTIYGTFLFGKENYIQGIRHTITPNVSYAYTPSFEQYYDDYPIDATGTTKHQYSRFQNGIYGAPSKEMSNNIGFNISNNFEAKVKDKDQEQPKRIKLLNSLNFSSNYDISRDSLKWSELGVSTGIGLLDNKMQINLRGSLNPYALDKNNNIINSWNITNGGNLFRLSSASITVNYSLNGADPLFGRQQNTTEKNLSERNGGRADGLFGKPTDIREHTDFDSEENKENISKFFNSKIPWNLTLAYSISYANSRNQNEISSNSLMFSGNITPAPGWNINFSSGYDFKNKGFTYSTLGFERDLKSWRMSFNWVPNRGEYSQWAFFIGIKSSILSDIKYDTESKPDKR